MPPHLRQAGNGDYGLACEHAHSCCVLLARRERYFRDGAWHTWIDYERFQARCTRRDPIRSDQILGDLVMIR